MNGILALSSCSQCPPSSSIAEPLSLLLPLLHCSTATLPQGRVASEIQTGEELVLTEMIFDGQARGRPLRLLLASFWERRAGWCGGVRGGGTAGASVV